MVDFSLQGAFHPQNCLVPLLVMIVTIFYMAKNGSCKECTSNENKYSQESNEKHELSEEEMFKRGHMKPFGSHRPPDFYADELEYMISPEDFYMNYVVAHKPVVIKGELVFVILLILHRLRLHTDLHHDQMPLAHL